MADDWEIPKKEARQRPWDVVVIGAGHNGLVASIVLARAGLDVLIVEARDVVGGAARTERPFARAPALGTSTGAYLVGLVQPELLSLLDVTLPLLRRDPHYLLPTTGRRHLLFGSDERALEQQFSRFFSPEDYRAHRELTREISEIRDDVAPTWLSEPVSIEETAQRHVRASRREAFVQLCRGSIGSYLDRFEFRSELLQAMYGVTDAFSGLSGGWNTPGSGMNFLIHNMCRLPGSDGTWMLPEGGMGSVSLAFARAAARAGVRLLRATPVARIECGAGGVDGVATSSGDVLKTSAVVAGCDPFSLRDLVGRERFSFEFNRWLDERERPGTTLKLNLALSGLPRFSCLEREMRRFGPTVHLLPGEPGVLAQLESARLAARRGELPERPAIEWYVHSALDPSLSDPRGTLSSALFVQWVPYELSESTWEAEGEGYADHLLSICDQFAPGTSGLVVDRMLLTPPGIERRFGMRHGHIHHVDNSFGFADRFPHRAPVGGLYSCSAGTHPAGSVIGSAGYLAARRLLGDLGISAPG